MALWLIVRLLTVRVLFAKRLAAHEHRLLSRAPTARRGPLCRHIRSLEPAPLPDPNFSLLKPSRIPAGALAANSPRIKIYIHRRTCLAITREPCFCDYISPSEINEAFTSIYRYDNLLHCHSYYHILRNSRYQMFHIFFSITISFLLRSFRNIRALKTKSESWKTFEQECLGLWRVFQIYELKKRKKQQIKSHGLLGEDANFFSRFSKIPTPKQRTYTYNE